MKNDWDLFSVVAVVILVVFGIWFGFGVIKGFAGSSPDVEYGAPSDGGGSWGPY